MHCYSEGADRAAAGTNNRRQGSTVGQLRNVPSRRAADGNVVGEVNARPEHEEIRPGGARVHRSLRTGEERDQRAFHRGEPGKVEGHDGAAPGEDAALYVTDRRDAVCGATDGGRAGYR